MTVRLASLLQSQVRIRDRRHRVKGSENLHAGELLYRIAQFCLQHLTPQLETILYPSLERSYRGKENAAHVDLILDAN